MLPQIVLLFCVAILNTSLAISLQKCCPKNYDFDQDFYCQKSNETWTSEFLNNYTNITWSIPMIISENLNLSCDRIKIFRSVKTQTFYLESGNLVRRSQPGVLYREFCLEQSSEGDTVAMTCPCANGGVCVNACCEEDEIVDTYSDPKTWRCVHANNTALDWKVEESKRKFFVHTGGIPKCHRGAFGVLNPLYLNISQTFEFEVLANGTLYSYNEIVKDWMEPNKYCVAIVKLSNESTPSMNVLHCFWKPPSEMIGLYITKCIFYFFPLVIASFFYLATLLVHALVPDLRRAVRGLSLMAHCACMLAAHIVLTLDFLRQVDWISNIDCQTIGYCSQFMILVSIYWLNVMCIDISITFRSMQNMARSLDLEFSSELRKFLWYCVYAFGVPFLLVAVTVGVDHSGLDDESSFKPNIGISFCWFHTVSFAAIMYFYGPAGLALLFNIFLFVFIGCKIASKNSLLQNMSISVQHRQRKRFIMFGKLGTLMAIHLFIEIVGWAVGNKHYYFYLFSAISTLLRSIFIFLMFCCKQKVWEMLKNKSILTPILNWSRRRFKNVEKTTSQDQPQQQHSTQSSNLSANSADNRSMELQNSADLPTSAGGVTNPAFDDATQL